MNNQRTKMKLVYEDYPVKVQLSKARRVKFFDEFHKIPKKYEDNRRYQFVDGHLYDIISNERVVANPLSVGTPNYVNIGGNDIMRMHERKRMKIVDTLKDFFLPQLLKAKADATFMIPVSIHAEVYCPMGWGNWDIDNLWIYGKCFLDALRDSKLIKDDNIQLIRSAGGIRYNPIQEDETRKIVFTIQPDDPYLYIAPSMRITELLGKPGEISLGSHDIFIHTGKKKVLYQSAERAIRKAMFHCMNNCCPAWVDTGTYERFKKFFECFKDYNVPLEIR